jgi:hypothetical protein
VTGSVRDPDGHAPNGASEREAVGSQAAPRGAAHGSPSPPLNGALRLERVELFDRSDCPNGPDEYGNWPCDPQVLLGGHEAECQVCGRVAAWGETKERTKPGLIGKKATIVGYSETGDDREELGFVAHVCLDIEDGPRVFFQATDPKATWRIVEEPRA